MFATTTGSYVHHRIYLCPPKYICRVWLTFGGGVFPSAEFSAIQKSRSRDPSRSFFDPAGAFNLSQAIQTLEKVQEFDAKDNVFFVGAHDYTIRGIVEFFPAGANDWKAKGWREKAHWKFLEDFQGVLGINQV